LDDPVEGVTVGFEIILATFVADPEEDQEAAGHAEGEPEDIDKGEGFVVAKGSPGDGKVTFEHGQRLWLCVAKGMPII
jgi:hypothetical protein